MKFPTDKFVTKVKQELESIFLYIAQLFLDLGKIQKI